MSICVLCVCFSSKTWVKVTTSLYFLPKAVNYQSKLNQKLSSEQYLKNLQNVEFWRENSKFTLNIYCFNFVCVSLVSFSGSSFDLVNFLFTWALQKGRKVGGTAEHSSIHKCGSIFWCFVLVFVIVEVRHHELGSTSSALTNLLSKDLSALLCVPSNWTGC